MSVTFGPAGKYTLQHPGHDAPEYVLDAYYTLRTYVDGEMNVSNSNAHFICSDILGVPEQASYGQMDPDEMLRQLAVYDAANGVKKTEVEVGAVLAWNDGEPSVAPGATVIWNGRTHPQVRRYLEQLTRLANICKNRGVEVTWG